jgi:drug/metabolite transporter (DMT)-like permease
MTSFVPVWVLIALIVSVADVVYHYGYKSAATAQLNPFVYIAYMNAGIVVFALLVAVGLRFVGGQPVQFVLTPEWTGRAFLLAIPVLIMEAAILYTYLAGAPFSLANTFMSAVIPIITLGVGMLVFQEKITLLQGLGIGLCVAGSVCIAWQGRA